MIQTDRANSDSDSDYMLACSTVTDVIVGL